jgi:hypothetical protein
MKYLIVSETHGFFLGAHTNEMLEALFGQITAIESSFKKHAIFAKENPFGIYSAVSFSTKEDAQFYIDKYLSNIFGDLKVVNIASNEKYINVIDLIKANYGKYTHDMMDNLPTQSDSVH